MPAVARIGPRLTPSTSKIATSATNHTSAVARDRNTAVRVSTRAVLRRESSPAESSTEEVRRPRRLAEAPSAAAMRRRSRREMNQRAKRATIEAASTMSRIVIGLASTHSTAVASQLDPVQS